MALSKEQCKEILDKAVASGACHSNSIPAEEAYRKGDYETFEQICRGNYDWLMNRGILNNALAINLAGNCIEYGTQTKSTFSIDCQGKIQGLKRIVWGDGQVHLQFFAENTLVIFAEYLPNSRHCKIRNIHGYQYVSAPAMQSALAVIQVEFQRLDSPLSTQE